MEKLENINIHTFMSDEDYTDVKEDVLSKVKVYFKDDERVIYADNQIGYHSDEFKLKHFTTSTKYDIFKYSIIKYYFYI